MNNIICHYHDYVVLQLLVDQAITFTITIDLFSYWYYY